MENQIYIFIKKNINGKIIILLFTLLISSIIIINFSSLPFTSSAIKSISGGQSILDLRIYYTPKDIYSFFNALGVYGRRLYLYLLIVDFFIPVIAFLFTVSTIIWLIKKVNINNQNFQKLIIIPFFLLSFDYAENISNLYLMNIYPEQNNFIARLSSFFTILKGISGILFIISILILIFILLYNWLKNLDK